MNPKSALLSVLLVAFGLAANVAVERQLVDSSAEVRAPLLPVQPPHQKSVESALIAVLDAQMRREGRRGGRGGGRRHGRRRNPARSFYKPLLRALKREDRRELKQIVMANTTKAEIAERVQKWVREENDAKINEAFSLFTQERALMAKLRAIGEANFLDGKSAAARQLFQQLKQIKEDQSLTWDATCTLRNQLLYGANQAAVRELRRKGRPCTRNDSWERLTGVGGANKKPQKKEEEDE
ncbi:hypothetical protein M3Y99_00447800 [Aphelenchoides fujianensis]|nr:hypothetical protein M3Y99_00447800 [Aphelenchoides fujianensis]